MRFYIHYIITLIALYIFCFSVIIYNNASFPALMSAPKHVRVESITATSAIVSWDHVNKIFSDSEVVMTQVIDDGDDNGDSSIHPPKSVTVVGAASYQLTDLVPSTRYSVNVASIKAPELSFGPHSDDVVFTTLAA